MIEIIFAHWRDLVLLSASGLLGFGIAVAIIVRWPHLVFLKHDEDAFK